MNGPSSSASAPPAGRPRDQGIDSRVIEAALAEMAARGFAGMSIDRVAERSGVGKPAIYRRYADKAALAVAALASLTVTEEPPSGDDLASGLSRQLLLAHGNLENNGGVALLGALLAEGERRPRMIELYRERLLAPRMDKIRAILADAASRGEVRADIDVEAAALLLLGLLPASYVAGRQVSEAGVHASVRLLLAGLASR